HRVFQALTGETLAARVRRRRLEVAAYRLLMSPRTPALRIALDVGFASAEVFTRTFRLQFGVTPTAWRRGAFRDLAAQRRGELSKIHQDDRNANQAAINAFLQDSEVWPIGHISLNERLGRGDGSSLPIREPMKVDIKTLSDTRVAYMRHTGPYGGSGITRMWQTFGAWCASHGFTTPRRRMYGISRDNPDLTAPEQLRYDAAVEVDDAFQPDGEVAIQIVPGGRYACAPFTGTSAEIHGAWMRFFADWLPDSAYQCDDRPPLEIYDTDFAMDEQTGAFTCFLCIPVRPL
ncbi:MAG: AraC family transcriptional regulator, partial [bacterium]